MKAKNKLKKAFTLIELVVVIAVIAILAGVSVAAYFGVTESAKKSNVESLTKQVKDLYTLYRVEKPYVNDSYNSLLDYGREFIDEYLPIQGIDKNYVNFTYLNKVDSNGLNKTNDLVSLFTDDNQTNNNSDDNNKDLIFFITDKYTSYFIVDGESTSLLYNTYEDNTIYSNIDESVENLSTDSSINSLYSNLDETLKNNLIFGYDENNEYQPKVIYVEYKDTIYSLYNGQSLKEVTKDEALNSSVNVSDDNDNISINTPSFMLNGVKYDGNQSVNVLPNEADKEHPIPIEIEIPNEGKEQNLVNFEYLLQNVYFNDDHTDINFYCNFEEIKSILELKQNETKEIDLFVGKGAKFNGTYTLNKNVTLRVLGDVDKLETSEGKGYKSLPAESNNNSNLTIKSGSTLTILGSVYVGSNFSATGTGSPSTFRNIGTITIENDATLNFAGENSDDDVEFINYGKVVGKGLLNINSRGYFRQTLLIYDWLGGAVASGYANSDIFPFNKYRLNGVDCRLRVNAGAQQDFDAFLTVGGAFLTLRMPYVYGTSYTIKKNDPPSEGFDSTLGGLVDILAKLKANGLFNLSSGYIEYTFEEPDPSLNELYPSTNYGKRTIMNINGEMADSKIEDVGGKFMGFGIELKFSSGFPIYNMGIVANKGSTISLNNNAYKILPGSYVKIFESTLNIGTKVLFYDRFNFVKESGQQDYKWVFIWIKDGNLKLNDWNKRKNISENVVPAYMNVDSDSIINVSNGGVFAGCYVGEIPSGITMETVTLNETTKIIYNKYNGEIVGDAAQFTEDLSELAIDNPALESRQITL